MIIIRQQREFALRTFADLVAQDDLLRVPLELMKSFEMLEAFGGKDILHWISEKVVRIKLSIFKENGWSPQLSVSPGIEENYGVLRGIIGENNVRTLIDKYGNCEGFNKFIQNKMLTETKNGEAKYKEWFNNNPPRFDPRVDYPIIYKTIALGLSGQVGEDILLDPWGNLKEIQRQKVNYRMNQGLSDLDIRRIIAMTISGITGILLSYEPLKKLMM